jgi:predicted TIM-barrel fold metal-dependent hydrolase
MVPVSRRSVLLCGASAIALGGCRIQGGEAAGPAFAGAIDVHTHIFNASDVPVAGFVRRVALGDWEEQRFPETGVESAGPALAALLVRLLSAHAPTADEELTWMAQESAPEVNADGRFRELLADALEETLEPSGEPGFESELPGKERLRAQVMSEAGVAAEATPGDMYELADGLLASDGLIGRHVRWAKLLLSSRQAIVKELDRLYGGDSGTRLFTPALVDMALWLDGEPRSPIASQIRVTEALQRRTDFAMHAFAPFDPWREARDSEAGKQDYDTWRAEGGRDPARLSALGLVQWAVEEMGFVGVKLYPPMGFRPAGNAQTRQTYPARAIEEFPTDFPQRIDAALGRLYDWCDRARVPVLAHAANSQDAAEGYGERAAPANWMPVIRDYPALRICLAHFGRSLTGDLEDSWDAATGALMQRDGSRVFADLSYHSAALTGDLGPQATALARFFERYDPEVRHLVFGSDWSMLGRERGHGQYVNRVESLLLQAGLDDEQLDRFFRRNAIDYLGLVEGEPSFERLERYYAKAGLDFERIRKITGS